MKKIFLASIVALSLASTARAQPSGWDGAAWVWDQPEANRGAQSNEPRYLRRSFKLASKPVKAELWITADNHYTAYINGQKVGADGEWASVEKYDVAKHLVVGKNVLALVARNEGAAAGVIARLHVQTADGKTLIIGTDAKTRITQIAPKEWLRADFDDAGWGNAIVLGDASIEPWRLQGRAPTTKGGGYDVAAVDPKVKTRLSPAEQLKHFHFPKGFAVELVVADPTVINPVTMTVDDKGRIYVSESHTYRYGPSGSPIKPFANPVVRLDPLPDGKGYKRTPVADGFDDPVMGIAVKGNKLWLTANNYLYLYDVAEDGKATNKKTILIDKNKAWNPFGMFVLEWGPDGLLYLSVGNHNINIEGPDGKIGGRGSSGLVMRMNPDGTKMERLVHGLRVPYSFDVDPFGQLWLLSNGEGNPNRFVRVIDGVDYHCYSRGAVDNNWLAGNHPLAPPCFELTRGADTQLLRYYGAAFPTSYQGSLLLCNWGAHGFAGPNRAIFRFVPDAQGKIVTKESLLSCTDPHFRPSHIALDADGNLLISDWYGRDDESDMTGRIWRLKYTGADKPVVKHALDSPEWSKDEYALSALGSPHHLIREKAVSVLVQRLKRDKTDPSKSLLALFALRAYIERAEPLGAAYGLWTLFQFDTSFSRAGLALAEKHSDARIRRLSINLQRRGRPYGAIFFALKQTPPWLRALGETEEVEPEKDASVLVEMALSQGKDGKIRDALLDALRRGAAKDEYLRYEAAWHLAKHADRETFAKLLAADDEDLRLAGMIAIDVACYENFPAKSAALAALGRALEEPGKADLNLLLTLAQLDGDSSLMPALQKLLARPDLPAAAVARAVMILRSRGALSTKVGAAAGKRLIEAVAQGTVRASSPAEQLTILEFLEAEGPSDFALRHLSGQLRTKQPEVREAAHALARRFGAKASPLAGQLWTIILDPRTKRDDAVELLTTLARIDAQADPTRWQKLLTHPDSLLRTEAVRWGRSFKNKKDMADLLLQQAPTLLKDNPALRDDLAAVLRHLEAGAESIKTLNLPPSETDKSALTKQTLAAFDKLSAAEKQNRALLGRQVFERTGCTSCHTTATQTTPLAPSLKGIAAQKIDYLIESVLFPSKIIKTGFETETITTKDGKIVNGLVKDEGLFLRVLNLNKDERIAKSDIEERSVQRVSIMPEGQEAQLSRREFADLIAYLLTLK
jgi:quinoprotein glucose dehydrogenase